MPKRKTFKEFYNECKSKELDLPLLNQDYINNKTSLNFKCSMGHIYEQTPNTHLGGSSCPKCKLNYKKTPEQYYQECKDKGLDLPIEDYINTRTKIKHKCSVGHIYEQTPHAHLRGQGCHKCENIQKSISLKKSSEQYYQECKDKGLDLPIEDYKGDKVPIEHRCIQCNAVYKQTPNTHLRQHGCRKCAYKKVGNKLRKDFKTYKKECKSNQLPIPVEDYVNNSTKIKHKCNKCGHIWEVRPRDILSGYGCPRCDTSKGEKYVETYLNDNNIKYEPQKTFDDLKDVSKLSYDFYLPDYNILIEYQGIQHYESVSFDGKTFTNLDKQQCHDNLKRKYAKDNGYKLLELHYSLDTQDKVDKYLKRRIK